MTHTTVAERLRELLLRTLGSAPPAADVDLVETGAIDSLALVELLVAIEHEFGIRFASEELEIERFRSLDALTELVGSHLGAGA